MIRQHGLAVFSGVFVCGALGKVCMGWVGDLLWALAATWAQDIWVGIGVVLLSGSGPQGCIISGSMFMSFHSSSTILLVKYALVSARLLMMCLSCHGMTSLPPLCPPLATSNPICIHSTSSASAPLQLQCILVQLVQLHCTCSQTNHRSIPDPFRPGSHAKGCHLYTLSTFVLFA